MNRNVSAICAALVCAAALLAAVFIVCAFGAYLNVGGK